jgi:hypothetical protein
MSLEFCSTIGLRKRSHLCRLLLMIAAALTAGTPAAAAAPVRLKQATLKAWKQYYRWTDDRVSRELSDPERFLIADYLPPKDRREVLRLLTSGEVIVRKRDVKDPEGRKFKAPDGELHHWWGSILVPGTTLAKLLAFLQDYDHHAGKFEDVQESRLISQSGNYYKFYFRLMRSKAMFTAHYNTIQEATYTRHGEDRASSRSLATRIAELDKAGTPQEKEKPPGDDRGFLWKLVSWWRFQQVPEGVIVEIESASLSRNIPFMIRMIPGLSGYIRSTPKESLRSVLTTVRTHATPSS